LFGAGKAGATYQDYFNGFIIDLQIYRSFLDAIHISGNVVSTKSSIELFYKFEGNIVSSVTGGSDLIPVGIGLADEFMFDVELSRTVIDINLERHYDFEA